MVNFELTGADFIVSPLTLPNVDEFEGFLTIRTESANGSIIIAEETVILILFQPNFVIIEMFVVE